MKVNVELGPFGTVSLFEAVCLVSMCSYVALCFLAVLLFVAMNVVTWMSAETGVDVLRWEPPPQSRAPVSFDAGFRAVPYEIGGAP